MRYKRNYSTTFVRLTAVIATAASYPVYLGPAADKNQNSSSLWNIWHVEPAPITGYEAGRHPTSTRSPKKACCFTDYYARQAARRSREFITGEVPIPG